MFNHRNRMIMAASTAITAGALALSGGMAATAGPASPRAAASGTEAFQIMTTSGTTSVDHVIASGVFTVAGLDHENNKANTSRFVFPNGTAKLRHSAGTGRQTFNPKTCLLTISEHGTYKWLSGTGKYAGITGSGKYQLSILAIGARSNGRCSNSKPPVAFQLVIRATGSVHL